MTMPRGIRNNNPGNLREPPSGGDDWIGERATDDDPIFEEFEAPEYGIRAIAKTITNYYVRYGMCTVRGIIGRWAPPDENNTKAYIDHVCQRLGVGADQVIDPREIGIMPTLIAAIILYENGVQPYDEATIKAGVMMA